MRRRLAFLPCLLASAPAFAQGAPIEIAVTGVTSSQGRVHVDICTEAQFLHDCPLSGEAPAHAGTTIVTVANVPPGRYAAQGFHDRNGNGKVDRNLLGIPREDIGFSNDAPVHMAPPKFKDAAFEHGATPQRIGFRVHGIF